MATDMTGIRQHGNRYEVNVRVRGELRTTSYPLSTPIDVMQQWRAQQKGLVAPAPVGGSFADDIQTFVTTKAGLPFTQFADYPKPIKNLYWNLTAWAQALGRDRSRHSITAEHIDRVIEGWQSTPMIRTTGRSAPEGLSPGTILKRRGALMALFKALNGPKAANPVSGSNRPRTPKAEIRGVDMRTLLQIVDAMADWRPTSPPTRSLSKIRARIMAYTGLPPGIIGQLGPKDWSRSARKVFVPARLKGGGVEARNIDLGPESLAAFVDLDAANGYGPFSTEAFNRVVKRAAAKVGGVTVKNFKAYDIRHSYLSHVYVITKDEATVARLGLHAEGSVITRRYTKAAHAEVDRAAVEAFSASLASIRREALKVARKPAAVAARTKKRKVG